MEEASISKEDRDGQWSCSSLNVALKPVSRWRPCLDFTSHFIPDLSEMTSSAHENCDPAVQNDVERKTSDGCSFADTCDECLQRTDPHMSASRVSDRE
ncbi:uncharacterized protein LOC122882481 isoform X4 [Siniperca chuatsi]|uniref:uncharacterized protein LOC122882481 isoform X4 n=1 Tax=Siniperca chuatsi TaxID=119488 RepID=UPI001CE1759C|nr:uncharacterized protein LOC122882481 isoform X4 [Siniperca chuatsi]